jgi:hypothetical protein
MWKLCNVWLYLYMAGVHTTCGYIWCRRSVNMCRILLKILLVFCKYWCDDGNIMVTPFLCEFVFLFIKALIIFTFLWWYPWTAPDLCLPKICLSRPPFNLIRISILFLWLWLFCEIFYQLRSCFLTLLRQLLEKVTWRLPGSL